MTSPGQPSHAHIGSGFLFEWRPAGIIQTNMSVLTPHPFLNLLNVQEITGARVAREHTLFTDTVWVVCDAEFRHMSVMQGNFWRRKCMCFLHRSAFHIRHTPSLMQQICKIKIVNILIIQPRSTLKIQRLQWKALCKLNPHVYGHINIKCCTFSILQVELVLSWTHTRRSWNVFSGNVQECWM